MLIVVADYSGHPFQVQLSRELARRGHSVLHLYFSEFQTPKGRLEKTDNDPQLLEIEAVSLGARFEKHRYLKRRFQEVLIGKKFAEQISRFSPDIVLASNLPLDALQAVQQSAKKEQRAFVFWQQDIYSLAIERILRAKFGAIGGLIGAIYRNVERKVLLHSQAIVAISEDFIPYLKEEFAVEPDRIHVVRNWAPLDEITRGEKNKSWAAAAGLTGKKVVLYTGTIGHKHDPSLILALARRLNQEDAVVVVASEGPAADWLRDRGRECSLASLRVIGFQPYESYSELLSAADVLIAILEPDAGVFSVPSKVLSYLCAGRPIALSAPAENLASRIVIDAGAGTVVEPGQTDGFVDAVVLLLADAEQAKAYGGRGRRYAEVMFDIKSIADQFEGILAAAHQAVKAGDDPSSPRLSQLGSIGVQHL